MRQLRALCVVSLGVLALGCVKWFPGKVGTGVARLGIRNVGAVVSIVSQDSHCGFASDAVSGSPSIEGDTGNDGVVTWTVSSCTIDLGKSTEFARDCQNAVSTAGGTITVSAKKTISGRLTGNIKSPVVPAGPDAVSIEITDVSFDNFVVKKSTSDSFMKIKKGHASGTIAPRLGRSAEKGVCAIATPNVAFENVNLSKMAATVTSPDRTFDVDVKHSSLNAQNGTKDGSENYLKGTIKVWDSNEEVPTSGDHDGLDPEYDAKEFEAAYACTDDLQFPVSYTCDLEPALAQGVSRLGVLAYAALAKAANDDTNCGFSSQTSLDNSVWRGAIGDDGGDVSFGLGSGCTLDFPEATLLQSYCNGDGLYVRGRAVVTGTKKVTGYVTGDSTSPIVPTSRDPATISLSAVLTNFEVWKANATNSIKVKSGRLSGKMMPRTALDTTTGACSISTPVATFDGVNLENADVDITSDGSTFALSVTSTRLTAQNGKKEDVENVLIGQATVDGRDFAIPTNADDSTLDPNYHALLFDQSYQCDANMVVPAEEAECSFRKTLAQGAARLAVKTFGVITKVIDDDDHCGFMKQLVPTNIDGNANEMGTMQWNVNACVLGDDEPVEVYTDCNGKKGFIEGAASVSSEKTVVGKLVLGYPPILPQDRTSVVFAFSDIALDEFRVYDVEAGETEPAAYLELHDGSLTGKTYPVTGEAADKPGAFFIKTPVAHFADVKLYGAHATLVSGSKRFNIQLDDTNLDAFNGSFVYDTNRLSGTVVIDGVTVEVPINEDETALDPAYNQTTFDDSYICKENLRGLVPASGFVAQ